MVRNYVKKGGRGSKQYNQEDLEKAIREIKRKKISYREAAKKYKLSTGTLYTHMTRDNVARTVGRRTVFSYIEEEAFISHLITMSEWGFPMDVVSLRLLAKSYLDMNGISVGQFQNNMPGIEWARNFLKRHKAHLTQRYCQNISSKRAQVSKDQLESYFNNLQNSLHEVSPDKIINYDETNVRDDPGSNKMIFKRSVKHPERIMNSSKTCTSIMFSCTASGEMLPPYVVYKAEQMWQQWTEGGPAGARYNRSKSGWFDDVIFTDWFNEIIVPFVQKKQGPFLLIGDNLSSHFSSSVLQKCSDLNIRFVCLPPNSTHLTQPLDVSVYRPLKGLWRKIVLKWKTTVGPHVSGIPKSVFPQLLRELMNQLQENVTKNIYSGFASTGIHPFNPERVISKLPNDNGSNTPQPFTVSKNVSKVVVSMLESLRNRRPKTVTRRTKLQVQPGKSVCGSNLEAVASNSDNMVEDAGPSRETSSSTSDSESTSDSSSSSDQEMDFTRLKGGDWVLVKYKGKKSVRYYVGSVIQVVEGFIDVRFARHKNGKFLWPEKEDVDTIDVHDVVRVLPQPTTDRRGSVFTFKVKFHGLNVE